MAKKGLKIIEHPPYLLVLAPTNFFLFSMVKDMLTGINHPGEMAKTEWEMVINNIFKEKFTQEYEKQADRWDRRIERGRLCGERIFSVVNKFVNPLKRKIKMYIIY